ncbi:MAG TPA: exodeoxyribonuclease VII large subunit [Gammaproteobacteria bacterium]|nr:exodeoxyribonuclease VII large subunit [Gammaproteobacteria bacterium]
MRPGEPLQLPFEERRVLSVSGLNREARQIIEESLGTVWVEGEISNLSRPSSGHLYWSLKDAQAQIRCAMFRLSARGLAFELANGRQVQVRGRVSLYEARGEFQLIVDSVEEAGEGLLRRRFEELKKRLAAEGLFDAARKRPLPKLPGRIGVITSPTGAALRDVLIALRRRFPSTAVLVYPTSVQGAGAADEICRTLKLADRRADCDVLILTRGGGSLEDLWAFNEEAVARAVAAVELPIIVGVGHEIDFTIADFAADLRAPTPSQAAELAVPDQSEWLTRFSRLGRQVVQCTRQRLATEQRHYSTLAHRLSRCHPGVRLREQGQRLDELESRLHHSIERSINKRRTRLARLATSVAHANPAHRVAQLRARTRVAAGDLRRALLRRLEDTKQRLKLADRALASLSPLATLQRGYAIVQRHDDGGLVTDSAAIAAGTQVDVRLARGTFAATVDRTTPATDPAQSTRDEA